MIELARQIGAPMSHDGTELEAVLTVSPPDQRRLPLTLVQDEGSMLRGLSSPMPRAAGGPRHGC